MLELARDNVVDYLREHGWLDPGPAHAETLSGGVSNQVLRITGPNTCFVVKQSRTQLRTRDAWFSDLDRIWREQEVMQVLLPFLPAGTVPGILFVDRPNYAYGMTHAPFDAVVWKQILLSANDADLGTSLHDKGSVVVGWALPTTLQRDGGQCPPYGKSDPLLRKAVVNSSQPALAHQIGLVLGMMHEQSARHPELMEPFRDHTVYVQLRVDPFYRRIQERRPEVAHVVAGIIEEMLSRKEALCHGDYTPKNMLVHAAGFTLVDYETAHFGDPTMDLGLFLAHILLKACRDVGHRQEFFELTRSFWRGYAEQVSFKSANELQARGIRHLGVCILARIDGTSPVDYLSEPQRDAMRRLGRRVLLDRVTTWHEVLGCCEEEMR